jgi:hypothetical protein
MKLINRRVGWSVEGKFIAVLDAGVSPTLDEMLAYYELKPGDARFSELFAPHRYARAVMLKLNGNFIVTPLTPDINEVTT